MLSFSTLRLSLLLYYIRVCRLLQLSFICEIYSGVFFFFSSRRRHTRFKCDWSSDVCSSDLDLQRGQRRVLDAGRAAGRHAASDPPGLRDRIRSVTPRQVAVAMLGITAAALRSEERRVGKECRSRWSPYH